MVQSKVDVSTFDIDRNYDKEDNFMKKRIFSLFLAVTMLITAVPFVMAEETTEYTEVTELTFPQTFSGYQVDSAQNSVVSIPCLGCQWRYWHNCNGHPWKRSLRVCVVSFHCCRLAMAVVYKPNIVAEGRGTVHHWLCLLPVAVVVLKKKVSD